MKKYLLKVLILIIFIIGLSIPSQVKAYTYIDNTNKYIIADNVSIEKDGEFSGLRIGEEKDKNSRNDGEKNENSRSGGQINTGDYKPDIQSSSKFNSKIGSILGALQVVGGIAIVISIAMIGLNMILGTTDEKASAKGKEIGILVGAIMITAVSTIAKFIISVVE